MADFVVSTSRIIAHVVESHEQAFIIGTESGILHPLRIACPGKTFYRLAAHAVCPDMKKIGLRDVLNCLEQNQTVVQLDEQVRSRAAVALERMIAVR
jgi:quinolinate synthase